MVFVLWIYLLKLYAPFSKPTLLVCFHLGNFFVLLPVYFVPECINYYLTDILDQSWENGEEFLLYQTPHMCTIKAQFFAFGLDKTVGKYSRAASEPRGTNENVTSVMLMSSGNLSYHQQHLK